MRPKQKKLLVIDDAEMLRHCLAALLRVEGFEVDEASDGSEGLSMLRLSAYDAVISDVEMEGVGGIAFVKAVRQEGMTLPVVLTSAHHGYKKEALTAGASAFVEKPAFGRDYASLLRMSFGL